MQRQPDEDERHHRAFLLYAMQDPEQRSLRAVARAISASDNSVRKWRGKHDWHSRMQDPEHCRHACDLFASTYHAKMGGREVSIIQERLGAPYVPPGHAEKSEVARSVDLYEQVDREEALAAFDRRAQQRNERLRKVLDATLGKVGRGLVDGDIKPRPSDIRTVLRGYEMLEKAEQRRLAMMPSADEGDAEGDGVRESVATSQRVLQAQQRGGDVLRALEEDAEELLLVVRTMREHENHSNVVAFPGSQTTGDAEAG
jgi:hypothetical protein